MHGVAYSYISRIPNMFLHYNEPGIFLTSPTYAVV